MYYSIKNDALERFQWSSDLQTGAWNKITPIERFVIYICISNTNAVRP